MSSSEVWRVTPVQVGRLDRWVASLPIEKDLAWGCQSNLSVGTRSRVRRVFFISWSNSGRIVALMFMVSPHWEGMGFLRIVVKTSPCGNVRVLRFGGGIEEGCLGGRRSGVEEAAAGQDAGVGIQLVG